MEKRLNRRVAADYVTGKYGFRLSHRTLEATPVPYIVVNGQAIYQTSDLDHYALEKITAAARRTGGGARRAA